mgnify:CR=1 FL=1
MNDKVKVLVCKSSSCFVEPSCSEPNRHTPPSFSSTPWTAQVAIQRKYECDYAEIFVNTLDSYAEVFGLYTHFVLFGSVFYDVELISLQILLLKIGKKVGFRTLLIGNQQGFEQDLQFKSGVDVIVSAIDSDPIVAIDLLEENGFLAGMIIKGQNNMVKKIFVQKNVFVVVSPFWVLEQKFVVLIIGVLPIILSNVLF